MKIAIISDIYHPMTNGVAVFAHNLAEGLARMGHEILVVCPSFTGKFHMKTEKSGVKIASLTSIRFPLYPDQIGKVPDKRKIMGLPMPRLVYKNGIWFAVNPYFKLEKLLNEFQPDVIHLQTAETIAIATRRYVKKYGTPLVTTGHAYPDNITAQFKMPKLAKVGVDAMLRVYMASFLKHAEYATMPTEMAIEDLVPGRRRNFTVTVEAVSNGVDLSAFKPGKAKKEVLEGLGLSATGGDFSGGAPRILYVGRVDPEKSISRVLEAFALASPELPAGAELVVVGDGTDLVNLRKLAGELAIAEKVKFLGKVVLPELAEVYRGGAVFATASETETQGIVLMEAAASGLPLVTVDAGAVGELCRDDFNGILCKPGDVSEMAAAFVKILRDKELQARYSKGSLEVAKGHDLNRTLERFVEIYGEAIEIKG